MPGITPGPGLMAGGAPTVSYRGFFSDTVDRSSYTFSVDIGAAVSDRLVAVSISYSGGSGDISSVTIAGVTAMLAAGSASNNMSIWYAVVPSGSGAQDITVALTGTRARMALGAWTIRGLSDPTRQDFAQFNGGSDGDNAVNLDVATEGVIIAGSWQLGTSDSTITGVTERFDETVEGDRFAGGDYQAPSAEANREVRVNPSVRIAAASWR